MDDIYFSDKSKNRQNRQNQNGNGGSSPVRRSRDEYSGKPLFTEQGTKKKFVVNIPEEELMVEPRSRTPKGQPVSSKHPRERMISDSNHVEGEMPEYTPVQTSSFDASLYSVQENELPEYPHKSRNQYSKLSYEEPHSRKQHPNPPAPQHTAKNSKKKNKKKKRTKAKIIVALVCLFAVCLLALFGYGYYALGKVSHDDFVRDNQYIDEGSLMTSPDVKNILFLGSDARGDVSGQRSDTMILFSVNRKNHSVKMTSFLRDSYVYIPSKGYHTKLNAAFSYGGPQLLIDTIEYNYHIKIDDYVLIDFKAFQKLIDLMGGLTIDGVTEAEAKYMRDVVKVVYIKEGTNKMSGAASLWYCRIRYLDNDFRRTERQRKVINAIMKQALKTSPDKLNKIVNKVLPMISTSMDRNDLIPLGFNTVFNIVVGENEQHQVPADGTWTNTRINGQDVLKMDMDKNISLLKDFLY